jgi:mono/diheme cytochrome c family protein
MTSRLRWITGLGIAVIVVLGMTFVWIGGRGFTSRRAPWPLEASIARSVRGFLMPSSVEDAINPLAGGEEALRSGLEHFADHCASCHGNDGSGEVEMGRSLFPPAPDMRAERTQSMSDGELFYIIERGIPFTGMPAWSTGTESGEQSSWELVSFIRHLPDISESELAEMEALNPRSPGTGTVSRRVSDFLEGR